MSPGDSVVQVRVSGGILWVGGEAYPLRNISHVGQRRLDVDKGTAWKKFITRTLLSLVLGLILAQFLDVVGVLIMIALIALLVWRLVAVISQPPIYGLVINTSGTQRSAVWSTSAGEIAHLVQEVTQAISRPDTAHMTFNVEHAVVGGDTFNMYGAGSVGKQEHFGAGNNVGGR